MPNGVDVRGNSIRVYFRYKGELVRESVPGAPTKELIAYYERMVANINDDMAKGLFDYARYFPDSPRAAERKFNHYLDIFLHIKQTETAPSTFRAYKQKAEKWIRPKWGNHPVESIDYLMLIDWIKTDLDPALHNKSIREIITLVRQVFTLYRTRNAVAHDPTEGLVVRLPDAEDPEPFTLDEIDKILRAGTDRRMELLLVQFMIWAGPRVSEALALAWEDVDLQRGEVTFKRSIVRGEYRVTKTRRSTRRIKLLAPALQALIEMKGLSGGLRPLKVDVLDRDNKTKRQKQLHFVFRNSHTLAPHPNDFVLRDRFFKAHLKRAGVQYRGPSQCRHTFASQMLSSGKVSVDWVANYMGHTSTAMIWKHYGKWIPEDEADTISTLNRHFNLA